MAMTKQQIAEGIYDWFFVKDKPRSEKGVRCFYRGETENHRCAVGCLIPDELYVRAMENVSVDGLFYDYPEIAEHFGRDNLDFLTGCQHWHDEYSKGSLVGVFQDHGVDTSKMPLLTSNARWS